MSILFEIWRLEPRLEVFFQPKQSGGLLTLKLCTADGRLLDPQTSLAAAQLKESEPWRQGKERGLGLGMSLGVPCSACFCGLL